MPVLVASGIGFFKYGPSAGIEAAGWLVPMLFLPYFAVRPFTAEERLGVLRAAVVLCTVSAAYGWFQFLTAPPWDNMWLVQSGMTSSMGSPVPLKMRVWGTLNAAGTAGAVWAIAVVMVFSDRSWAAPKRLACLAALLSGLLITLVRTGWLMAAVGLLVYAALARGRARAGAVALIVAVGVSVAVALPLLPGADRIADRIGTFGNLSKDGSFRSRTSITTSMFDQIAENPLGVGFGFSTASKVSGEGQMVAMDNGYGDLAIRLGVLGAGAYLLGLGLLVALLVGRRLAPGSPGNADPSAARGLAAIAAGATATLAAFTFNGPPAAFIWLCCGIALLPKTAPAARVTVPPRPSRPAFPPRRREVIYP